MKQKLIIGIFICLVVAITILIATIVIEGMKNIEEVEFTVTTATDYKHWLNITISFKKLPEEGVVFDSVTLANTHQQFTATRFYAGDTLTLDFPIEGDIGEFPKTAYLWSGEIAYPVTIK